MKWKFPKNLILQKLVENCFRLLNIYFFLFVFLIAMTRWLNFALLTVKLQTKLNCNPDFQQIL